VNRVTQESSRPDGNSALQSHPSPNGGTPAALSKPVHFPDPAPAQHRTEEFLQALTNWCRGSAATIAVLAVLLALDMGFRTTDRVAAEVALLLATGLFVASHLVRAVKVRTLAIYPAFARLPELARHRRGLTSNRTRHALATSLRQIVVDLDRRPSRFELVPILRDRVTGIRSELLEIAAVLENAADLDPVSVALIRELLRDGRSPLYNRNCPAIDLHDTLRRAHAGLRLGPDAPKLADDATQRDLFTLEEASDTRAINDRCNTKNMGSSGQRA
jgi:hypothetical protein